MSHLFYGYTIREHDILDCIAVEKHRRNRHRFYGNCGAASLEAWKTNQSVVLSTELKLKVKLPRKERRDTIAHVSS